jgi:thiosulfate/3-mercaptopyruvate sulfurtransferase
MRRAIETLSRIAAVVALVAAAGCSETVKNPEENEFQPAPDWTDDRPASEQELEPQEFEGGAADDQVFLDAETVDQLANREEDPATVIDARTLQEYNEGHYPGAVHSGNRSSDAEEGSYKPFKDPKYDDIIPRDVGELQAEAQSIGVFNDSPVIIYADPVSKRAGRLHWSVEYLGHGDVFIYNPGYEKLIEKTKGDAETESNQIDGDFIVRRREHLRASKEEVQQVAEGEKDGILIDTRREREFTGDEKRAPRHGYIPTAEYYYWEDAFDDSGELRPRGELKSEFEEQGLMDASVVIPYCQTGTRSGMFYSVLRWVGADHAANYDGSWIRWAQMTDTSVAKDGEERLESSE